MKCIKILATFFPILVCNSFLTAAIPASERQALIDLFNATNGPNWTHKTNWLGAIGTENTWDGVVADVGNTTVVQLNLGFNNLIGAIPSSISNLSNLVYLNLETNLLTGGIPTSIGNLIKLQTLFLRFNQLSGAIPLQIGNLSGLQHLDLRNNKLSGNIPAEIGNLGILQFLSLSGNQLTGSIPASIGNLIHLIDLDLSSNPLMGSIPSQIGNLSGLQHLDLNNNKLLGNIPAEIGNMLFLRDLHLTSNQLTGSIPASIGNLTHLVDLDFSYNQLAGSIPTEIGKLVNLTGLHLCTNQLIGSIPTSIGNLKNLDTLDLSWNQLSGEIPAWIGNLFNLQYLMLHRNKLTGSIPIQIGNLTNLKWLVLGGNLLTDSIPTQIGNFINLKLLDLSGNQLTGSIPSQIGNLTNLNYLDLDSNALIGSIPVEIGNLTKLTRLGLSFNQCTGAIPTQIGNLTVLEQLSLSYNKLTGTIPVEIGNLTKLTGLSLSCNQLSGYIPISMTNLINLSGFDIGYNALFTTNNGLLTFLNNKDPNWADTQTIAPTNVSAIPSSSTSVNVFWTPIAYTGDTGGYRIFVATASGGPYTFFGQTSNKSVSSQQVTGLTPSKIYYFVLQTRTNANINQNIVDSEYSSEVSATTPSITNTITITSPNGGESWQVGSFHYITWSTTGTIVNTKIEYSTDNGNTWISVINSTSNNGKYSWIVPNALSAYCMIRVSDASTGNPSDKSDSVFSIFSNQKPIAFYTYSPTNQKVEKDIVFDASGSSDADGEIVYYEWDLNGDGEFDEFAHDPKISFFWLEPGTFEVGLRVTDNNGAESAVFSSTVNISNSLLRTANQILSTIFGWLSPSYWKNHKAFKRIDDWMKESPTDNRLSWLKDTNYSWCEEADIISIFDKDLDSISTPGFTYKTFVLNIIEEEKLMNELFYNPNITYGTLMKPLLEYAIGTAKGMSTSLTTEAVKELANSFSISTGIDCILFVLKIRGLVNTFNDITDVIKNASLQTFFRETWDYDGNTEAGWQGPAEELVRSNIAHLFISEEKKDEIVLATKDYYVGLWSKYGGYYDPFNLKGTLPKEVKAEIRNEAKELILSGLEKYKKVAEKRIIVNSFSPVELRVYDLNENVTGLVNGVQKAEIPNSTYDEINEVVKIFGPDDSFYYEMIGKEEGFYGLEISTINEGSAINFNASSVPIGPKAVHKFYTDWDKIAKNEEGVSINIDYDGNGTIEHIIKASTTFISPAFYTINLNTSIGGLTKPSIGAHNIFANSAIHVTAFAEEGYLFNNWEGDIPAGHENDNPLTLIMDSNKSLKSNFTVKIYPTIKLNAPNGAESWKAESMQNITWLTTGTVGNVKIEYSIDNGSNYSTIIVSTANTGIYAWKVPNTPSAICLIRISETATGNPSDKSDSVFSIVPPIPPLIALSKNKLNFGAKSGGVATQSLFIIINNAGGGTLNWTAVPQYSWITATPGSGTGSGALTIGVNLSGMSSGNYSGTVTVMAAGATNSPQAITLNLQVYDGTNAPIGVVDTPTEGITGIEGSVPVTGWAVDDIEVVSVKIYRDPMDGEGAGPNGYVYIGDSVFVEGARPDVEQAYPTYPLNYRAGWGYMMLTNFLPNGGNGTFRLHAIATDKEGNSTLLGSRTITCDNAHAVLPFGAIDVPSQGGTASGSSYINYAWVLATLSKCIPTDGSTITAWVDGLPVGHPSYGYYRVDIATLFPGYCNANGAIGYIPIDTTKYSNGVHTIVWSATDSGVVNNGFGSRYFTIQNSGSGIQAGDIEIEKLMNEKLDLPDGLEEDPIDRRCPVYVRKGFDQNMMPAAVFAEKDGRFRIEIQEIERVEIQFGNPENKNEWQGYLKVGDELRELPIGATLDASQGILYWQPGPGFLGDYEFVFLSGNIDVSSSRQRVIVTIKSKEGGILK